MQDDNAYNVYYIMVRIRLNDFLIGCNYNMERTSVLRMSQINSLHDINNNIYYHCLLKSLPSEVACIHPAIEEKTYIPTQLFGSYYFTSL